MPYYNGTLFEIDKKEMMRYAGLNPKDPQVKESVIDQAIREALALAEPKGIWQIYPYNPETGTIGSTPPLSLMGESIKKHLRESCFVGVLAVTVGEAIEQASHDAFENGEYMRGLLLDAAATTCTEHLADQVDNLIQIEAKQNGQETVWRFSPGYGDWPVTQQNDFARIIETEKIGLYVTDHSMLFPRKSVTAIIGISSCGKKPLSNKCNACSLVTCPFRQQGGSK